MIAKIKYFSFEVCDEEECPLGNEFCLSVTPKKEVFRCSRIKIREMLEEWICDRCGRTLSFSDTRHKIGEVPPQELQQKYPKTYVSLIHVCDSCITEEEKAREIFEFNIKLY